MTYNGRNNSINYLNALKVQRDLVQRQVNTLNRKLQHLSHIIKIKEEDIRRLRMLYGRK